MSDVINKSEHLFGTSLSSLFLTFWLGSEFLFLFVVHHWVHTG